MATTDINTAIDNTNLPAFLAFSFFTRKCCDTFQVMWKNEAELPAIEPVHKINRLKSYSEVDFRIGLNLPKL